MGNIKIENLPWTQPAFAPLYSAEAFPVITRERWHIAVTFETDYEFVQSVLPEGVDPASDPPVASVWCATHAHSTMGGPYREAGAGVIVTFEGETYFYPLVVYLGPNSEEWFAAGREVWGHQKSWDTPGFQSPKEVGLSPATSNGPKGAD